MLVISLTNTMIIIMVKLYFHCCHGPQSLWQIQVLEEGLGTAGKDSKDPLPTLQITATAEPQFHQQELVEGVINCGLIRCTLIREAAALHDCAAACSAQGNCTRPLTTRPCPARPLTSATASVTRQQLYAQCQRNAIMMRLAPGSSSIDWMYSFFHSNMVWTVLDSPTAKTPVMRPATGMTRWEGKGDEGEGAWRRLGERLAGGVLGT